MRNYVSLSKFERSRFQWSTHNVLVSIKISFFYFLIIIISVLELYDRKQGQNKPKPIVKVGKVSLVPHGNRTYFFWNHFKLRFPCLSRIAHLVLQLPSSSAGIERTFSRISHQFDSNRSRLKSKTLLRLVQVQEQEKFLKILKSI